MVVYCKELGLTSVLAYNEYLFWLVVGYQPFNTYFFYLFIACVILYVCIIKVMEKCRYLSFNGILFG
jgi:hypothetical protein